MSNWPFFLMLLHPVYIRKGKKCRYESVQSGCIRWGRVGHVRCMLMSAAKVNTGVSYGPFPVLLTVNSSFSMPAFQCQQFNQRLALL